MNLYVGFYGEPITVTSNLNLTGSTVIVVHIKPPIGAVIVKTLDATAVITPVTGVVSVPIAEGDLATVGYYDVEVFDQTPGRDVPSAPARFYVGATI